MSPRISQAPKLSRKPKLSINHRHPISHPPHIPCVSPTSPPPIPLSIEMQLAWWPLANADWIFQMDKTRRLHLYETNGLWQVNQGIQARHPRDSLHDAKKSRTAWHTPKTRRLKKKKTRGGRVGGGGTTLVFRFFRMEKLRPPVDPRVMLIWSIQKGEFCPFLKR